MQSHSILSVEKLGLDYAWFNLIAKNKKFIVYDSGINWVIAQPNQKDVEIEVNKYDDLGQVEKCTISGSQKQIKNIMHSIGLSVPEIVSDSVYMLTIIDLKNKLDYLISEVNELKNAKEIISETV